MRIEGLLEVERHCVFIGEGSEQRCVIDVIYYDDRTFSVAITNKGARVMRLGDYCPCTPVGVEEEVYWLDDQPLRNSYDPNNPELRVLYTAVG